MKTELGNNVLLIHRLDIGVEDLNTFFLVAHGVQQINQFGLDRRTTLYFPWGVGQFGLYETGVGFPLHEIMMNERFGRKQGFTNPDRLVSKEITGTHTGITSPLLHFDDVASPDIALEAKDLDEEMCEQMLSKFYSDTRHYRFPVHVGVICLDSNSSGSTVTKKLSEVLAQIYPNLSRCANIMVYCLCCSVKEGDDHRATVEAEGYVAL